MVFNGSVLRPCVSGSCEVEHKDRLARSMIFITCFKTWCYYNSIIAKLAAPPQPPPGAAMEGTAPPAAGGSEGARRDADSPMLPHRFIFLPDASSSQDLAAQGLHDAGGSGTARLVTHHVEGGGAVLSSAPAAAAELEENPEAIEQADDTGNRRNKKVSGLAKQDAAARRQAK